MKKGLDFNGPQNIDFNKWKYNDLNQSIFERFKSICLEYPENIAVYDKNDIYTYKDLMRITLNISKQIELFKPKVIGIYLNNGADSIISMFSSLKLGIPYIPLDCGSSNEYIEKIIKHSGIDLIISDEANYKKNSAIDNINVFLISEVNCENQEGGSEILCKSNQDSIATIIYTSGTTGLIKGVYQSHQILLHDIMQYSNSIHISSNDKFTLIYQLHVGGAIRDIFGALLNGASLICLSPIENSLREISELIYKHKVTIFHAIPHLLRVFINSGFFKKLFSTVRIVYIAGDKFYTKDLVQLFDTFPEDILIYNGIGATECTTLYCQWFINKNSVINNGTLPVGFELPDKKLSLINENNLECSSGEIGEAVVTSKFIGLGYWNDEELTKNKFINNNDERIYHTGDMFLLLEDGNLEFVGRKDSYEKLRGFSINLSLLESVISKIDIIKNVIALLYQIENENYLVVVVKCNDNINDVADIIKKYITSELPYYYMPNYIFEMENIPILSNFKYDIISIKKYIEKNLTSNKETNNNGQSKKDLIVKIWNKFLPLSIKLGKNETLENLGGDSLTMINLLLEIEKIYPYIKSGIIYKSQTLNGLLIDLEKQNYSKDILFVFPPRSGSFYGLTDFANKYLNELNIKIVQYPGLLAENSLSMSVNELGEKVAINIFEKYKNSKIHLLGLSFGTRIAHEALCFLESKEINIKSIIMWDIGPSNKPPQEKLRSQNPIVFIFKYIIDKWSINSVYNISKSLLFIYSPYWIINLYVKFLNSFFPNHLKKKSIKIQKLISLKSINRWSPKKVNKKNYLLYSGNKKLSENDYLGWDSLYDDVIRIKINSSHNNLFNVEYHDELLKTLKDILSKNN